MKLAVAFALESPPPPAPKKTAPRPSSVVRTSVGKLTRRKVHAWLPPKGNGVRCGDLFIQAPQGVGAALKERRATWIAGLVTCARCLDILMASGDAAVVSQIRKARQIPIA